MDNAVALVQTYLDVNGYFTVAEYPIIRRGRHGGYRTVTDLDILAFRFPGATRLELRRGILLAAADLEAILESSKRLTEFVVQGKARIGVRSTFIDDDLEP